MPFKLGKDRRLKSRKLISKLFKDGKAVSVFPLRAVYLFENCHSPLQAGFSVSSRNFKKAVDRNRIKRILRESYRTRKTELEIAVEKEAMNLQVFFLFTGKEMDKAEMINGSMAKLLANLLKLVNDKAQREQ